MVLDLTYFGSGIGLVLVSWITGLAVSYVFNLIRVIPLLSGKPGHG